MPTRRDSDNRLRLITLKHGEHKSIQLLFIQSVGEVATIFNFLFFIFFFVWFRCRKKYWKLVSTSKLQSCGCTSVFECQKTLLGAKIAQNFSSSTCGLKNIENENQQIFIDNLTFVYVFICHRQQQRVIAALFLMFFYQQFQCCLLEMFYSRFSEKEINFFPPSMSELMFFIFKSANRKTSKLDQIDII